MYILKHPKSYLIVFVIISFYFKYLFHDYVRYLQVYVIGKSVIWLIFAIYWTISLKVFNKETFHPISSHSQNKEFSNI